MSLLKRCRGILLIDDRALLRALLTEIQSSFERDIGLLCGCAGSLCRRCGGLLSLVCRSLLSVCMNVCTVKCICIYWALN